VLLQFFTLDKNYSRIFAQLQSLRQKADMSVSKTNTIFTNLSHCYAFIALKQLMFCQQLGRSRLPGAIAPGCREGIT